VKAEGVPAKRNMKREGVAHSPFLSIRSSDKAQRKRLFITTLVRNPGSMRRLKDSAPSKRLHGNIFLFAGIPSA
jgi:hypothetical protein